MKTRIFSCLLTAILVTVLGCGGQRQSVAVQMQDHFPKKSVQQVSWNSNDRLIVLCSTTSGPAGAVRIAPESGALVLFGVAGMLAAKGIQEKVKSDFLQDTGIILEKADYQTKFARLLEQNLKARLPCEVMMASPKAPRQEAWKPSDKILTAHIQVIFAGSPTRMMAWASWNFSVSAEKFEAVAKGFEKAKGSSRKAQEEYNKFDGFGTLFYESAAFPRRDWQAQDGQLLNGEINKAIVQLAGELSQALSGTGRL